MPNLERSTSSPSPAADLDAADRESGDRASAARIGREGESLGELLAARAGRASDLRLALDVAGGLLVVAGALAWRPTGWLLAACVGAAFLAFGGWGIADRELAAAGDRVVTRRLCEAARAAAVMLGALAVAAFVFTLLFGALGNWIS